MHVTNITRIADNNMGALLVLSLLNAKEEESVLEGIDELGLKGYQVWVLYKHICKKNLDLLEFLLLITEETKLIKACSNREHKGTHILKEELEAYKRK